MVEEGDEYAQKQQRGPLRVHRSYSNNTNRMTNEEHGARNGVGIDHNRDSTASRPIFPLLSSSSSLSFLSIASILNAGIPSSAPLHAYL